MNTLICLITIKNILTHWKIKYPTSFKSELLVYIGVITPLGDYILRFVLGEIWFQTSGLIFHSFIFQGGFWGLVALLNWVYRRRIRQALNWLLPLVGLMIYALFCLISTEAMPFFSPLSHSKMSLNLVNAGYLIPLILAIMVWMTQKWTRLGNLLVSRIAIGVLVFFIILMGFVQLSIYNSAPDSLSEQSDLTVIPTTILPYNWVVVSYQDKNYLVHSYNLFKGWSRESDRKDAFHNYDMVQIALTDPRIFQIYSSTFKNPVINASIEHETMLVEVSELIPYSELLWVDNLRMTINKTGQIIEQKIDYRTLQL